MIILACALVRIKLDFVVIKKNNNPEVSGLAEQMSVSQLQCLSTVVHQGGSVPYSHLGSQLVRNVSILHLHHLEHMTSWVTT